MERSSNRRSAQAAAGNAQAPEETLKQQEETLKQQEETLKQQRETLKHQNKKARASTRAYYYYSSSCSGYKIRPSSACNAWATVSDNVRSGYGFVM
ncbi:hypothetical protein NCCP2716_08880 [Sporosarcina sp. NCCP-2716]|nr:hypothetical protein NCCP2716_08880 [Sporosarcina sp. NCCP-2716]